MDQANSFLGKERISKILFRFSFPCVLSLLISSLYNIVDQIFVGNSELGYLGNAATGIVFPILIIAQAFAWCIGDGAGAYLSLCQGRKDIRSAHKCIGTGITVTLILSVILLSIFLIFKEPLLRLFGASDNTIFLALEYFTIVIPFFPIFMFMNMMNSVIRADGSPAYSMLAMATGAIINIIMDPIFIFVCHYGIAGAAWATVIGQIVSFLLTGIYCFRTKSFQFCFKSFIPDFKIFKDALLLGVSTFITQVSIVIVSLICNIMLAKYGALSKYGSDIPISAISIETKVFTIIINIVVGIALGGQPIIGYNYGAGNMSRVKKAYQLILFFSLGVGLISTILIELFPTAIISIFGSANQPLYLEFTQKLFRVFLSLVTATCLIKMTSIFFQAVGQTFKATIVSLTRDVICFIPLVICLPLGFGIDGILYAAPIADSIGLLVGGSLTILFFKSDKMKTPF